jgi:hypothetical protein
MIDVTIGGYDDAETSVDGAEAEVDFFAISARRRLFVEVPNGVQYGAFDAETEAVCEFDARELCR